MFVICVANISGGGVSDNLAKSPHFAHKETNGEISICLKITTTLQELDLNPVLISLWPQYETVCTTFYCYKMILYHGIITIAPGGRKVRGYHLQVSTPGLRKGSHNYYSRSESKASTQISVTFGHAVSIIHS